jgi:hypothetical protein|tara:strand:- start:170 stop:487 length:318 start_codon:yes stop_codon:yes gene_type:complete
MKFGQHHYKPLIEGLTVKSSPVNGLGLHATEEWKAAVYFGETHVWNDRLGDWIRTPLGGFINHSDKPNCFILTEVHTRKLFSVKPIKAGEELTVYYTIGYDDIIQ